ncbi:uncharacterized protein MYCFIDRAFT_171855 [Pseudocercospora fijiensis CIRAD86]|uniref:Uncharacterized protein n=1 Tax=Pseudocercospora fijiensis (strain CIRAD86) TaxID=383855 RepID=M3B9N8_PSEFD|nr:uncharacterized protein MYCFIDRAFT_171855 [Pseudocercospora fijiensis CIRAD86]EME86042.1 hypothetical protein MYCFIDRAFT_171855 [Pseudocercospora fijiensis CIRAD86]
MPFIKFNSNHLALSPNGEKAFNSHPTKSWPFSNVDRPTCRDTSTAMPLIFGFDVPSSFTTSLGSRHQDQETLEAWRAFERSIRSSVLHYRDKIIIWQLGFRTTISEDWSGPQPSILAREREQHRFICTIIDEKDDMLERIIGHMMESAKEEFGESRVQFWCQLKEGEEKRFCEDAAEVALAPKREEMLHEVDMKIAEYQQLDEERQAAWLGAVLLNAGGRLHRRHNGCLVNGEDLVSDMTSDLCRLNFSVSLRSAFSPHMSFTFGFDLRSTINGHLHQPSFVYDASCWTRFRGSIEHAHKRAPMCDYTLWQYSTIFFSRLDIDRYAPEIPGRARECCIMALNSSNAIQVRSRILNTFRAALREFGIMRVDLWYLSADGEKVEATIQDVVAMGLEYAATSRSSEHQACHAVGNSATSEQIGAERDRMSFEEVVPSDSEENDGRSPLGYANVVGRDFWRPGTGHTFEHFLVESAAQFRELALAVKQQLTVANHYTDFKIRH